MEAAAARNSAARNSTARSSLGSLRAILSAVLPRSSALQVNGVFQFNLSKPASEWVVDCKAATVKPGKAAKADVTLTLSDADFVAMAAGKLNGMQAFMSGKMKIKGNMALAQKFGALVDQKKSKL